MNAIDETKLNEKLIRKYGLENLKKFRFIPLEESDKTLSIAVESNYLFSALSYLSSVSQCDVSIEYCPENDVERALNAFYKNSQEKISAQSEKMRFAVNIVCDKDAQFTIST